MIHKQGMGFTLCNHHKASKIRNWAVRVVSQSSGYEKDKRGQEVQVSRRFDLWIELDLTTITIELISISSSIIQMTTRKVMEERLVKKSQ